MSKSDLTSGAITTIMTGGDVKEPVFQVLGMKKINSKQDQERYRLLLSDGVHFISFAMLATQLNDRVQSGQLETFTVIRVKQYVASMIKNNDRPDRRILVILDLESMVAGDQVGCRLGDPVNYEDKPSSATGGGTTTSSSAESHNSSSKPSTVLNNGSATAGNQYKPTTPNSNKPVGNLNMSSSSSGLAGGPIIPIASVSPYQNRWVIRVRVSNKSQIRTWSNSRGEGKLFSLDLMDESGEIRATAFRDQVDKFYDLFEVDKVYLVTKCQVKMANKQFTSIKNDYELVFTGETQVELCTEEGVAEAVPRSSFNFVPLSQIVNESVGGLVDVIGVCREVGEVATIIARSTNRELRKREVTLVDQSNTAVVLTLWGNEAESFDGSSQPIVALRGAKVGEFGGGRTLGTLGSTLMKLNPDLPEAYRLKGWFDNSGKDATATNISARSGTGNLQTNWMNFRDAKDDSIGKSERGDYYQNKAVVVLCRSENCLYKACPIEDCKKKIIDLENGMYRCEKCNKEYPNFRYRLLMSVNVCDWCSNQWVSTFSAEAEKVLGMTSQEVGEAAEQDREALVNICTRAHFTEFIFKFRAKLEMYNDETRLKTVCIKVDPINHEEYTAHLISQIESLIN